ncbi:Uncharacterized protein DAT39_011652 [Clarias magur]|uniref:Uncharacterized protein n=1 Tax=Clarias magur TaxID=1594786 RepID=A0A8J4U0U2_CLAMG|nr:Uncharacterized protein DAT39_011652 [Clarias magur]
MMQNVQGMIYSKNMCVLSCCYVSVRLWLLVLGKVCFWKAGRMFGFFDFSSTSWATAPSSFQDIS